MNTIIDIQAEHIYPKGKLIHLYIQGIRMNQAEQLNGVRCLIH